MSLFPECESWSKKEKATQPQKNLRVVFVFNLKTPSQALQNKKDEVMEKVSSHISQRIPI